MLKIRIPVDKGNEGIKNGTLPQVLEKAMADLKPEAAYFYAEDGERTAVLFFDLKKTGDIPAIVEPFFLSMNARAEIVPVMNAEDLKAGLGKLAKSL
jgi:hypothetical protein